MEAPLPTVDARALAQILAAQSLLSVLPTRKVIAEFYAKALTTLPGVLWCRVCLEDIAAGECAPTCNACPAAPRPEARAEAGPRVSECSLMGATDTSVFAVGTADHHFGLFVVRLDQAALFEAYWAFVGNLASFVALALENRVKTSLLRAHRDELERRVTERTEQLRSLNEELKAEIAERKRTAKSLQRVNRELLTITRCRETILRAEDEQTLLGDVCHIVCEIAGYRMATVAYAEHDAAKTIRPVAWGGADEGYLAQAQITWADVDRGRGPAGVAVRTGKASFIQDFKTDPHAAPWRAAALQRGYRSCISLPLKGHHGSVFGVFALFSTQADAFTPGETRLLQGLTDDLAFGILALRARVERERAEEALRKLSRAVEQSPASVVITDTTGKIEYVNPKFTEATGYAREEVLGENPRLLKSGRMHPSTYEALWRTITAGETWHGEFHNRKKNGDLFWELTSISPVTGTNGTITHYLAVKEDITARKRLEDQLRQAQRMEAVGQLAGGVAHDFNNILTAILMTISVLRDDPRLTGDMGAGLEDLEHQARRAASLTRQLLLFSRRQTIEARPVNLNEVVTNLSKMLRRLIGEDFDLAVTCPSAPLMANADPGMLEQVLMNLCVNARDAMPKGGSLSITTSRVELDGEPSAENPESRSGSFICLSVADSGCGMDDETRAHIFEPFFTTKEVGRGTGLGLATVYGIVKEHRGWVHVESFVGRGTVFRVYLPARLERVGPSQAPTLASARGGTETILLVEDDVGLRRLSARRLRSLGYAVFEAGNGVEALAAWGELRGRVDLLLTDMVMPGGMTGLDLAKRLVQQSPGLRVILVSGYNREKISPETLAATGITFIAKPYDAAVLAGTVRACLDRPKTLQPRGGA